MPKAEIGWERAEADGTILQHYAQHVGREWVFYQRLKRYDCWELVKDPPIEDWLELLDSIRRRIGRGMLKPQDETWAVKRIRERFPDIRID